MLEIAIPFSTKIVIPDQAENKVTEKNWIG